MAAAESLQGGGVPNTVRLVGLGRLLS